ncbi:uncharacterized protein RSE6_02285 [Rhynchosporium secalis]|uniref:Uncharacterized protein n=1 Tax=Rhynchosporium secalis TaxID=38038 RepID=A0A1E1LZW0_RHYSE|nr:uncharacterized protein RSE6_02285 [Rhynchosporium secalis]
MEISRVLSSSSAPGPGYEMEASSAITADTPLANSGSGVKICLGVLKLLLRSIFTDCLKDIYRPRTSNTASAFSIEYRR